MKIGVTGHQERDGANWDWVYIEISKALTAIPSLIGLSCLAAGTDQIFAAALLDRGGLLKAVIPIDGYSSYFNGDALAAYERLSALAEKIELKSRKRDEQAFLDAGKWIVRASDRIIAVWDGQDAEGAGGTGDVVAYARSLAKPVVHLDPIRQTVSYL